MGEAKPEETAKAENKPEEKIEEQTDEKAKEKKEEEKAPPPPPPVVLYVDMHCVGCAKKMERCLLKCKGVEEVKVDISKNEVTIKGIVEPQALCMRLQRKTKRTAKVLSPPPPAEGETQPQIVSSQVNEVTTVVLQINMHCAACAEQLKKIILKMRGYDKRELLLLAGVQSAEIEPSNSKVTVTGTMEANRLVDYIYRRTGKQAIIVPPPEPEKPKEEAPPEVAEPAKPPEEAPKAEEKKEDEKPENKNEAAEKLPEETKDQNKEKSGENAGGGDDKQGEEKVQETKKEGQELNYYYNNEDMAKSIVYWPPVYVIHHPPPPQMFSDENPNACCIS